MSHLLCLFTTKFVMYVLCNDLCNDSVWYIKHFNQNFNALNYYLLWLYSMGYRQHRARLLQLVSLVIAECFSLAICIFKFFICIKELNFLFSNSSVNQVYQSPNLMSFIRLKY